MSNFKNSAQAVAVSKLTKLFTDNALYMDESNCADAKYVAHMVAQIAYLNYAISLALLPGALFCPHGLPINTHVDCEECHNDDL